jgi:hypothetical protein
MVGALVAYRLDQDVCLEHVCGTVIRTCCYESDTLSKEDETCSRIAAPNDMIGCHDRAACRTIYWLIDGLAYWSNSKRLELLSRTLLPLLLQDLLFV